MIKKILIITFVFLTFSCLGMQDKIDQQKLDLIKEKGLRWYLISKINWQEQNEQRNFPELLCDLIAAYADNQQPLTGEMKDWLIENIEIPFKENTNQQIKEMLRPFSLTFNPHNPDEAVVLTTGYSIVIVNFHMGKTKKLTSNEKYVYPIAYNPHNPNELAIGSKDKTIRIWNTDTDKEIKKLTGHKDYCVKALAYNPHNPNELASGSKDKTIRIWNTETAKEIKKLTGHTDNVKALVYNPHKPNELASRSEDKKIFIWNLSNLRKAQRICMNPSMEEAALIAKVYKAAQEKKKCELDEQEQKIVDYLHLRCELQNESNN